MGVQVTWVCATIKINVINKKESCLTSFLQQKSTKGSMTTSSLRFALSSHWWTFICDLCRIYVSSQNKNQLPFCFNNQFWCFYFYKPRSDFMVLSEIVRSCHQAVLGTILCIQLYRKHCLVWIFSAYLVLSVDLFAP